MGILKKLKAWMMGFGIMMGLVFPVYAMAFVEFKPGMQFWFNAGCVMAGIMVGGFSYFIVNQVLIKQLNALATGYRSIARGDFGYRVDMKSPDAVGEIASGFNSMAEELGSLVKHIHEGVDRLSDVSASLANFSSTIEGTIREEGLNMARITTSANELSESIKDVNVNLENSLSKSRSIEGDASTVSNELGGTRQTMKEIEISMMTTVESIEVLNRHSGEISDIVTMIDDIADQTNLLPSTLQSRPHAQVSRGAGSRL